MNLKTRMTHLFMEFNVNLISKHLQITDPTRIKGYFQMVVMGHLVIRNMRQKGHKTLYHNLFTDVSTILQININGNLLNLKHFM